MSEHREAEMNRNQRSLVNMCFEEGLYSNGIAVLARLRSPDYAPSSYHIQQLLYISLYPSPLGRENSYLPETPASPSKDKRLKELFAFSAEDVIAAQNLLFSFANTNNPTGILRALPAYPSDKPGPLPESEDLNSLFAKEAYENFSDCQSCWKILAEWFIPRVMQRAQQKGKDKIVHQRDSDELDEVELSLVSDKAWPILDWLLTLFERDEQRMEEDGLPRHSPLFLKQLPAGPNGKVVRWESDGPIGVLFYALQKDERGKMLGVRLMSILVNLASTTHIDFHTFVTATFARLSADNVDDFLNNLSNLPSTMPVLRFKIAILNKLLGSRVFTSTDSPRPQARARPRPIRRGGGGKDEKPSKEATGQSSSSIVANPLLPAFPEIHRAMESSSHHFSDSDLSPSRIKADLWLAYGQYQHQLQSEGKDKEWLAFLRDENWTQFLKNSLPSTGINNDYREVLNTFLISWKASL
ncbi:hypothetical protein K435DRAFT_755933 [Dendrothele bispora CBS 962.96]|uniref:Uncharacterized protein n=1 Tax=Dendrothele bispora (strain CBS 962.96) TaxID=1314807 RepID=A0A4S8M0J4_DENBC|nr:hypothetical protein K435DRAFT_755933 [Dendrothele bispora CBS 962.96]